MSGIRSVYGYFFGKNKKNVSQSIPLLSANDRVVAEIDAAIAILKNIINIKKSTQSFYKIFTGTVGLILAAGSGYVLNDVIETKKTNYSKSTCGKKYPAKSCGSRPSREEASYFCLCTNYNITRVVTDCINELATAGCTDGTEYGLVFGIISGLVGIGGCIYLHAYSKNHPPQKDLLSSLSKHPMYATIEIIAKKYQIPLKTSLEDTIKELEKQKTSYTEKPIPKQDSYQPPTVILPIRGI